MKILVVSGNPHMPQFSGGVESTTHELALEMGRRGHPVSVLCRLVDGGGWKTLFLRAMRKLSRQQFPADRVLGYPVYRQWLVLPRIQDAVREIAPDVAIVQIGYRESVLLARELTACGVPVLFYLHNVEIEELGGDPRTLSGVQFIANSEFTSRRYKELFGIDSIVLPPTMRGEEYVSQRMPANVTFINPHPLKGRDIALDIAERCPEIPFTFIESWSLGPDHLAELRSRLAVLPNVTFQRRTKDMKGIYSKAKILLAPSVWEEAWGRVATEAQFSGIPVVASDIGGLPEAVGPGGVLLDPKGPIEPWVDAVKHLWGDDAFYRQKSEAALAYSKRPEISPGGQIETILAAATALMSKPANDENRRITTTKPGDVSQLASKRM